MQRTEIESRLLKSVGYDAAAETLEVEFRSSREGHNGAIYAYAPFSQSQWNDFKVAEFSGRYFLAYIKADKSLKHVRILEDHLDEKEKAALEER